jgi:hypothetical protein
MSECFFIWTIFLVDTGQVLTITPLPAGHMNGRAIWKICKEGEEEIVDHKNERWVFFHD